MRAAERGGLALEDSTLHDVDGTRWLVAVFRDAADFYPHELHFYARDGREARLVHWQDAEGERFALAAPPRDANGDGRTEVVVRMSCGGTAWWCHRLKIYQLARGSVVELTQQLAPDHFVSSLVDLDGDGVDELLVTDASWETYAELDHASAPRLERVFAWDGRAYVHASRRYPDHALARIAELRGRLEEAAAAFDYLGAAASLLLYHRDIGRGEEGLAELDRYLAQVPPELVADPLWRGERVRSDFAAPEVGLYPTGRP